MVLQSVLCPLKQELQQKEQQWRRRCEELQLQVQQLQEDREELQSRLKGSHAQEGMSQDLEVRCKTRKGLFWAVVTKSLPKISSKRFSYSKSRLSLFCITHCL